MNTAQICGRVLNIGCGFAHDQIHLRQLIRPLQEQTVAANRIY